jgi:hypothetical protein
VIFLEELNSVCMTDRTVMILNIEGGGIRKIHYLEMRGAPKVHLKLEKTSLRVISWIGIETSFLML